MSPTLTPFRITRTFAAPRAVVWRAWTERDQLQQWFGPKGVTTPVAKQEFRPGGTFHYCMRTPDGNELWGRFVYREIVAPERLVWVNSFSNPEGGLTRPPFSDSWPVEMLTTVTLVEAGGQTVVTVEMLPLNAREAEIKTFDANHDSMTQGWGGSFEQLDAYLARPQAPKVALQPKITPFLWFDGQAEEAARFYAAIFPDSRILESSPMSVTFELSGQRFMALNGGPHFKFTEAISFFVSCDTQEEIDYYWEKLSAGGQVQQCGWLKDRFGLSWQIVPPLLGELLGDADPAKAGRVMQAMLQMVKLDLKQLKAAAEAS